jgi:hypothetical protein
VKKFLYLCVLNLMILNFFTLPVTAHHNNPGVDDEPTLVDSPTLSGNPMKVRGS